MKDKKGGAVCNFQKKIIVLGVFLIIGLLLIGLITEINNLFRILFGVEEGVILEGQDLSGYLEGEVRSLIYYYSKNNIVYPQNATINQKNGEIIPQFQGKIIDITATLEKVFDAERNTRLEAIKYKLEPYIYEEDMKSLKRLIGEYSTIISGSEGRKENIRIASQAINNVVILSEEIFSFNQIVGPRTKKNGFKEAPEIINGRLSLGIGGGICQVSSTLFNALKADEFKIIERHIHSKDISYVPDGKDVAVAWGYLDFKFKNTFVKPILIKSKIYNNKLIIKVLGSTELD